ncbi:AIPR protein [Clostridium tepidiprofundi DSM 19306]|uniref:AIPR protein n=1 Tax=Clostridium tepidiprofundi DSM 19306 TaxID=1121338 RepID=A0A151B3H6_9CLOT|nr:AIPR family protein [Clostridium tepidiprofundi]KYH34340.1 AIPR protein [Clostridium tepidiprofundi DSM 19306]
MQKNNYIIKNMEEYMGFEKITTLEKGSRFLQWILYYLFEKTDDEIECNDLEEGVLISDGANDGGIDAAFEENGAVHIIQAKFGYSHKYEEVIAFLGKIKLFIMDGPQDNIKEESIEVYNAITKAEEVFIYYITNEHIVESKYENIIKFISDIEYELNNFYDNKRFKIRVLDINKMEDFIDECKEMVPKKFKGTKHNIKVEKYFVNKENNTIIAEVSLKSLATFINKAEKYLFYSNIRNFLGKNKVNKKIAETYCTCPKNFWFYNNGITIVCDNFEKKFELKDGGAKIEIITPQIVNGCQTASTIYSIWKKQNKEKRNKVEGTILVKIIKGTNKRKEITRYTNTQTAVTGKDFFALEEFHQKLKKEFKSLGYNYEIQRKDKVNKKARGSKEYAYLFDKKFKNSFFVKDVVQAFAAGMHFKPAKARSISNLVPGGIYYDKLFNDEATPQNPKYYLFPYGVMYYSRNILGHKNNNKLKSSNLLYISIYFKIVLQILKRLKLVDEDVDDFIHCDDNILIYLDEIFVNEKLNKKLLQLAENVLKIFLTDSTIKRKIGDNLPKFLKSNIENDPEAIFILSEKINDALGEFDISEVEEVLLTPV